MAPDRSSVRLEGPGLAVASYKNIPQSKDDLEYRQTKIT